MKDAVGFNRFEEIISVLEFKEIDIELMQY